LVNPVYVQCFEIRDSIASFQTIFYSKQWFLRYNILKLAHFTFLNNYQFMNRKCINLVTRIRFINNYLNIFYDWPVLTFTIFEKLEIKKNYKYFNYLIFQECFCYILNHKFLNILYIRVHVYIYFCLKWIQHHKICM